MKQEPAFFDLLEKHGHRTALVTESSEISYRQLGAMADQIAAEVKPREIVFHLCQNTIESVAGYLGFLRARAVPFLLSDTIAPELLQGLIDTYQPNFIYCPKGAKYELKKVNFKTRTKCHSDLSLLLTTSGSTGSKKFVRLSTNNLHSNAKSIAKSLSILESDMPVTTMPMSYSFGLSILNSHLLVGTKILLTQSTLMEKKFWELVKIHGATTFGGVPYVYEMLKKLKFAQMDLPSLRYLTQAGGRLAPELQKEFATVCGNKNIGFVVMYGQTEATARISYLPARQALTKLGSVGIAIPGGELSIEEGELVYKGPNVSLGYAENASDLAKGDENHGVLHTGDLATRDDDGFFTITGRKKRFVKAFGHRVSLDELEQLLSAEGVECAIAGTDDNIKIFVTKPHASNEIKNRLAKITGLSAKAFVLKQIEALPRSESGKVLYSALEKYV